MHKPYEAVGHLSPISTELANDIEASSREAYEVATNMGRFTLQEVHFQTICYEASLVMFRELRSRHAVKLREGHPNGGRPYDIRADRPLPIYHLMPVIKQDGAEIIADTCWQQFVATTRRTPLLPKVLVGTTPDIQSYLRQSGLVEDPDVLGYWEKSVKTASQIPPELRDTSA